MMKTPLFLGVAVLVALLCIPAEAGSGRKSFRVKVNRVKKQKTPPGGTALVRVKVKNRTKEEQDVLVRLFSETDESTPFETLHLHLSRKEKRTLEVDCPVPAGYPDEKLRVHADVGPDEESGAVEDDDDTVVPVDPVETDAEWILGRDLYQANCQGCHDLGDRHLEGEDLGDWLEAIREGEDDMPSFPNLSKSDVLAMRKYFADPDREVEDPGPTEPPPTTVTYENTVKAILTVSCVACHRAGNAFAGVQVDTYATAYANRTAIVDSVEKNRMPTGGPLAAEKKTALRSWLDAGALEK